MSSQRMFIERLRRERFGIGQSGPNPLALMLQETIRLLSAELYQKDIHFLSELLQNAEDNTYHSSMEPSIEIYLTKTDVTGTGAAATLLLLNNEVGFSEKNIESLCGAGQSTKKGKKSQGYIGEKGIGFKSVFLVTKQPYIISNGFRIRFDEEPHNEAKLGYIVPEWVDRPTDAVLQKVCSKAKLPATVIILPLRQEKISEVAKQLTQIPAETLLFLSKIRMLSIYDQQSRPPTELALSRSVEMTTSKNGSVETSTTFLTASNGRNGTQHSNYYMFKQTLKVPQEAKVEKRKDVDSWTITLAFPVDDRISSSCSIGDIFSFLPSDIHSGLPFLINSDFLLVSSRETLLFDSPWNQGIFRCVPEVFYNAFELLLNTTAFGLQSIPSVARMAMYKYVPVNACRNSYLEKVRNDILSKLKDNNVILCASDVGRAPPSGQLCKPALARKVAPSFRELLRAAPKCPRFLRGSPWFLRRSSSYIVDSTLQENYGSVLRLLGVPDMSNDEYHQSLDSEDWMRSLPDDAYVKLLVFLSSKSSTLRSLKFLKYRGSDGRLQLASMDDLARNDGRSMYWDSGHRATAWLAGWTEVFQRWLTFNFVPSACAAKIRQHSVLENWLERAPFSVSELTACSLARQVLGAVTANSSNAKLAVLAMHFLFDLYRNDRSSYTSISNEKRNLPIVENDGAVSPYGASYVSTRPLLLPAACGAKWPLLLPSAAWRRGVRKLSQEYMVSATVDLSDSDVRTEFVNFLKEQFLATDIPAFDPVNEALPPHYVGNVAASSLLLKWIKSRHCNAPAFTSSIKTTKWLKTSHGYCCPTVAFLPVPELLKVLKVEDVPFVDKDWMPLEEYKNEFRSLGVACEPGMGYATVLRCLGNMQKLPARQVDTAKVVRFYQYLSRCAEQELWRDVDTIWVPQSEGRAATWKKKEECVIHDVEGLFGEIGVVPLDSCYERVMQDILQKRFDVCEKPSIIKFCELWQSWSSKGKDVEVQRAYTVWRELVEAKLVSSRPTSTPYLKVFRASSCVPSIPACEKNAATVKLLPPAKTVMVDQLELEHLFGNTNPRPWVAWYPTSQEINTQELYKVYSWLGVKTISECAESETDTSCMSLSLGRKLVWDKGYIHLGLFRAILGYLALSLSVKERQTIVQELLRLKEMELETSLKVHWTLRAGDTTRHAVSERMLYWNRERQELAYVDEGQRKKRNTEFGTEFARIIAEGLLFHHRDLIPGMERHLSMLAFSKFDVMEVDNMLIKHNMRLYSEDETFLKTGVIVDPSKADAEKNLHGGEAVAEMEPFVLPDVPETEEDQLERDSRISEPPADSRSTTIAVAPSSYSPAFVAATPLDNRKYLLEQAFQVLSSLDVIKDEAWTMELPDEVFNSEKISAWRETYLPTVRRLLDYPPEEGYLKPGMRTGISLDKMLTAAFLDAGNFPGVKGSSHHHLSVVGAACLNLCLAMELVKLDDNHHGGVNGAYKLTNTSLLAACFHACGLDESVLRSSNSAAVSDLVAASVARALLAVGFCAYDDGLGEVRRIYQEVFLAALGDALG
ncbi:uncharacterized protein LOC112349098 [Selaginella moellendorffii]|uniref:uncharacterized protein LOC112349098 n=1 Tax=Selaginella moellendorffii TaxID=88036 RepID=UPI000D1C9DA8|nr:uncharacterized protein LOC112349098 [Selaginella moellendorffii]|eukprot:XP_024538629.1 uncharacterized protein LOC112349098 [Selaginella moellendorffii]